MVYTYGLKLLQCIKLSNKICQNYNMTMNCGVKTAEVSISQCENLMLRIMNLCHNRQHSNVSIQRHALIATIICRATIS